MKKTHNFFVAILLFGILLSGCDKIEPPYKEGGNNGTEELTRKVLLEDYTGHTCVNCPTAAKKGLELVDLYEGKLIMMAVHAGYFADPKAAPFDNDYRTPAGTAWDGFFGMSAAGNPIGMINRQQSQSVYTVENGDWGTGVAAVIADPASIKIGINTTYNAANRNLAISLTTTALLSLEPALKIVACVVEDSIVSAQRNNDATIGGATITDYVHRHMLRENVNGTWGEELAAAGQATAGAVFTKNYSLTLNSTYNADHVSVIVFVYNALTYEILQVEEKHID